MVRLKKTCLLSIIIITIIGVTIGVVLLEEYPKEINITAHKEKINNLLSDNNTDREKDILLEDKDSNVLQVDKIPSLGYIYGEYDENKLIFVMNTKDEDKINYSNIIYSYNIDTNEVEEITRSKNSMRYIKNVAYDNGWIFWVEDKDKYASDSTIGEDWKMYGRKLTDNKTILIDQWNGEKEPINGCGWEPSGINVKDGIVVYCTIVKDDKDNNYYDCVNLYDIKGENKRIIDKVEFNNNRFTKPSIDEGMVVYTTYEIQNSQAENSQVRIFDLNTKEINKIKYEKSISYFNDVLKKGKMLYLNVYKDINSSSTSENTEQSVTGGEVLTYNIETKEWKTFIGSNNVPLKQYEDIIKKDPLYGFYGINNRYLGVGISTFSSTFIYDIKNNSFFDLLNEQDKNKWKICQSAQLNNRYCLISTWDNEKSGLYAFKLAE